MAVHLIEFGVYVFVKSSPETLPALSASPRVEAAISNKLSLRNKKSCPAVIYPRVASHMEDGKCSRWGIGGGEEKGESSE